MILASQYQLHKPPLPPDTERILELTGEQTEKGFEFQVQKFEESDIWASVKIARREMPNHIILYHPDYVQHAGYLVAHECGHILRLYSVPEDKRQLPATSNIHRRAMVYELRPDIERLARMGLPPEALGQLVSMWHNGLIRQLTNTPIDMRIERWLHEDYPGLSVYQEPALMAQMKENLKILPQSFRRVTPERIYRVSNSLNAAYAYYMTLLLRQDQLFKAYRSSPFEETGRRLGDQLWETVDSGYYGDMETIEAWSSLFGLDGWWEWSRI